MIEACRLGFIVIVKYLIEIKQVPIKLWTKNRSEESTTPLLSAIGANQIEILKYLISRKSLQLDYNHENKQLLKIACNMKNLQILNLLLNAGLVKMKPFHSRYYFNPFQFAIEQGNLQILMTLIDARFGGLNSIYKSLIKDNSSKPLTPFLLAIKLGKLNLVKYLITECRLPNNTNESNFIFGIALNLAVVGGKFEMVKLICKNFPNHASSYLILNLFDEKKWTSIMYAAASSNYERLHIFKYLFEKGGDIRTKNDSDEDSFLIACKNGCFSIVKYMVEEIGFDFESESENLEKENGFHLACEFGHFSIVKYLTSMNWNFEKRNKKNQTPFWIACAFSQLEIANYLISIGSRTEIRDRKSYLESPLIFAIRNGNLDVVKFLTEKAKTSDLEKEICMFQSIFVSDLELLKYFIEELGCNPNCENGQGKSLHFVAAENRNLKILKYLIEDLKCDILQRNPMTGETLLDLVSVCDSATISDYVKSQFLIQFKLEKKIIEGKKPSKKM